MEQVNGKYRFVGEKQPRFTINKIYNFRNGYTYDDDGNMRPYISMNWMRVEEAKHDLVDGWYKCNGDGGSRFTTGKYYYFKDGFTVDDAGDKRPCGGHYPQRHNDRSSDYWFRRLHLVPADTEQDAFDRVMKAAVACSDEMGGCHKLKCPYADFGADVDSSECHEMIKEEGRQRDDKLEWPVPGLMVRRRDDLIVYTVKSITKELRHPNFADIELESLVCGYWRIEACIKSEDFWKQYEAFDPATDGWNGCVVSTCDYRDAYGNLVLAKDHICVIANGLVCGNSPMRIEDPSEFEKKGGKLVVFEIKGECLNSPSKRFNYTGRALRTRNWPNDKYSKFSVGYTYNFINGRVADDENVDWDYNEKSFYDSFIPVNN